MDTKAKILELIRELGQAKELAMRLLKNIDYLASLGNDIAKVPELEDLTAAAVDNRRKIAKANFDVIRQCAEVLSSSTLSPRATR